MTEDFDALEAELTKMRPRRLSPELAARITAPLTAPRRSWSDRFLLSAIGSGAVAACVIVALLTGPAALRDPAPSLTPATSVPRAGDLTLATARHEAEVAEIWK